MKSMKKKQQLNVKSTSQYILTSLLKIRSQIFNSPFLRDSNRRAMEPLAQTGILSICWGITSCALIPVWCEYVYNLSFHKILVIRMSSWMGLVDKKNINLMRSTNIPTTSGCVQGNINASFDFELQLFNVKRSKVDVSL